MCVCGGGGGAILVERDAMKHLGAVLPLSGEVRLAEKTRANLGSVHELWEQESDIPIAVCKEQFQAEVLGGLRHQQQVARVPTQIADEWQRRLEHEIRRIAGLGEAPPKEYLRAPRPCGAGLWGY